MWKLVLHVCLFGFTLKVSTCNPPCTFYGPIAACSAQNHPWVPLLPSNIAHLYLDRNDIREINRTSLRIYGQLERLDLGMQKVQITIRSNAFIRQSKLTELVLGGNKGLRLEPRAFSGLFRLKHLYIDHCNLGDSFLAESHLQPLLSLETLDLSGNNLVRLRPGAFFSRLTNFKELNLKSNQIGRVCEEDLAGFKGKHLALLNLRLNPLADMASSDFDWGACGNPFRNIRLGTLDISTTRLNLNATRMLFQAIHGSPVDHIILSVALGKGFSHHNFPDPDESTFQGLANSTVRILDLSKNRIFALQKAVFSPLRHVKIINISQNLVNQIDRNAFSGLQENLRLLNLSCNLLGEVFSHTFENLNNLVVLDLSHNHIGVLGFQSFSGLTELRRLYLTGNSLRNLGFPASLPNLEFLLLKDNKINEIHNVMTLGANAIYMDVSENQLTNMEDVYKIMSDFKHLKIFFYGGNTIRFCKLNRKYSVSPNNSLAVMDLHGSSLEMLWAKGDCLDLFDGLRNLVGLNLSLNSLTSLPLGIFSGLSSIMELDLSLNALTYLRPNAFPLTLRLLYLSDNFLAAPDPAIFQSLTFLTLGGNRFHCDCHLEGFLKWLNVTSIVPEEPHNCEFPTDLFNVPLLNYSREVEPCEKDDEDGVQGLKFTLFVLSALLTLAAVIGGTVYARLRGQMFIIYKKMAGRVLEGRKPVRNEGVEAKYDVYLCFSSGDFVWAEAAFLMKLDSQFAEGNVFRCCFEARDFLPGEDYLGNIRDAIWSSRKTVCVVSKRFLKDGWCLEAFSLAQGRMLEELTNVLIMVVVGKVTHYQLMKCEAIRAFVQKRQYLVWPEDPQDLERFYEKLFSKILKNTKVKKFPADKAEPAKDDTQPQNGEGIELENIRAVAL